MSVQNRHYDPYSALSAQPSDIMEHLQHLRWYTEFKLAEHRLYLIAKHIDDPVWIKDKEEEWLNEPKYWNGHYGTNSFYGYQGEDWDKKS